MIAPEDVRKARVEICLACPHLKKGLIFRCGKCGCVIKGKTALARESCPDDRWPVHVGIVGQ
jgi:hypothetical protein